MKLSRVMRHALLYGSSIALMKGISLLMLPFIAQQLSTDQFGRLEVAGSLAVIGSIMIGLGLEDSLYRFAGGRGVRLCGLADRLYQPFHAAQVRQVQKTGICHIE